MLEISIDQCKYLSELTGEVWAEVRDQYYIPEMSTQSKKYQILQEFLDITNHLNLRFCITGGTLLGIFRDGDFIEWDDDIDCDCLLDDVAGKEGELIEAMQNHKYIVRYQGGSWPKFSFFKNGEKLSLGILIPSKSKKWVLRPEYKYPMHHFAEYEQLNFKSLDVFLPNNPEGYLRHTYGANWRIPIVSDKEADYMNIKVKRLSLRQWFIWRGRMVQKFLVRLIQ